MVAYIRGPGYTIFVDFIDDGYVKLDDWKNVNANNLMSEMREIAKAVGLELWAEIPFDPVLGSRKDQGNPVGGEGDSVVAGVYSDLADRIEHGPGGRDEDK